MGDNIASKLDKSLLKEQEDRKLRERSGKFNPSGLGRCYRYQFWNRKNEPETNSPDIEALRRFKVGKLFHNFLQEYFPSKQTEVEVSNEDIFGYADIVLDNEVVDIKSIRSWGYKAMLKKDYDVEIEKYSYILQLMMYVWLLGKKQGRLVFVEKDSLQIKEYVFQLTDWEKRLKEELNILKNYWNANRLPPPIPRAYGRKECKYCSFEIKCKGGKL